MYDDRSAFDPAPFEALTADDDAGTIRFRRSRDVGSVINVTFRFLRENLRELGTGFLYLIAPVAVLAAILSFVVQGRMLDAFSDLPEAAPANPFWVFENIVSPAYVLLIVLQLALSILVTTLALGYVERYRAGEAGQITPGALWAETRRHLGPVLMLGVLIGALGVLSVFLWIVPCLGILGWLVGAVYLFPVLILSFVVRVVEDDGPLNALTRAHTLIKGQWGPSFGLFFICFLIVFVAATLLSIPSSLVSFGYTFGSASAEPGAGQHVLLALGSALGVFVYALYVIPIVAAAFHYFNLVEQAEGTELHARVEAIGSGADAPGRPAERADGPPPPAADGGAPPASEERRPSGFRGGGFDDEGTRWT